MLIKLLGCMLLGGTGVILAISICRYFRRRLDTLDGFISFIQYIKGQVECYARPIGDIMTSLPPEILTDCNCPMGASSIEELIEESRIYLDRDTLRQVNAFATEFGSIFREEQTKRCDHYLSVLRERRAQLADKLIGEIRSACALSIGLSMCLMILLW